MSWLFSHQVQSHSLNPCVFLCIIATNVTDEVQTPYVSFYLADSFSFALYE